MKTKLDVFGRPWDDELDLTELKTAVGQLVNNFRLSEQEDARNNKLDDLINDQEVARLIDEQWGDDEEWEDR